MPFLTQTKTNWKFLLIVIVLAVIVGGGIYYFLSDKEPMPHGCTMEAYICPDGTAVGRTGPNCEFAECPLLSTPDETASWQTYRNEEYGFEMKYPAKWRYYASKETEPSANFISFWADKDYFIEEEKTRLVYISFSEKKLEEYLSKASQERTVKVVFNGLLFTEVRGYMGLQYSHIIETPDKKDLVIINNNIPGIIISAFESLEEAEELQLNFNQMLSTFRFIDKEENTTNWYRITITSNTITKKQEIYNLTSNLSELLGLPMEGKSFSLVYDIREVNPYNPADETLFKFPCHLFIRDQSIKLKDKYENENITVEVKNFNTKLIPYLNDPDYCESDEDCIIRGYLCAYGAFNYYQEFYDFLGCEGTLYPEENPESLLGVCDDETQHVEIRYSGSGCLNHQCLAKNKTVNCVEGTNL